jgi:hypothetical protein
MKNRTARISGRVSLLLSSLVAAWQAQPQSNNAPYPRMAPLELYLMEESAEVALARSAAPPSISVNAAVMVLKRDGYQTTVPGKNGFVCMVLRSWTAGSDDPDFWNPKLRGPVCFNASAARSYLRIVIKRTELVLSGQSKEQMVKAVSAAIDKKELPQIEPGAMCYMMSKQGYLNDRDGHWHPHLMFFVRQTDPGAWGAGLRGSPVIAAEDSEDRLTIFMVPIGKWSDGTNDIEHSKESH